MTEDQAAPAPPAPPEPPQPPRLVRFLARHAFLVLTLVAVALWLPGILSLPAIDRDESRFAQSSRQMLESGDFVDIRFGQVPRYKKPVGIYWLQAAATAITGPLNPDQRTRAHIWTYRLPSLLGGIAAAWLTLWLGRLFSAETGLVAARLLIATLLLTAEASMATTDAVLLAAIVGMQGVLLLVWRAAKENLPPPSTKLVMAGWAAFAIGILVKGPVAPAVALATIAALFIWGEGGERKLQWSFRRPNAEQTEGLRRPGWAASVGAFVADRAGWLRGTKPLKGVILALLITLPWAIAIAIQTQGAFFEQSLGNDFAAKLAEGQEGHGALPGYYLLFSTITLWPAILFLAPAIGLAVARRSEPRVRFLIAWALSWWLVVELVPTKLPNYLLPAFPPLMLLAALWLLAPQPAEKEKTWRRFLPWIGAGQFLIGFAALAAAPVLLLARYGGVPIAENWPVQAAVGAAAFAGLAALILFLIGKRLSALVASFAAAAILILTLTAWIGPGLDSLWISQRLATLVTKDRAASDPPPMLAGFEEPSLVFALGSDVSLTDGRGAADQGAKTGGLALVDDQERPPFLARLAELEANASAVDELSGFNYSRGKLVHVTLYRVAPLNPVSAPRVQ
jgi:4-amino-4-deoxy-L-arabinose transferase-like glycosyltransferase